MLELMAMSGNNGSSGDEDPSEPEFEYESEYRALVQSEALWAMADGLELDVKARRFVWPGDSRLSLQESVEHICRQNPGVSREQVEGFLISHIENYAPEECTEEQLDELDRLAEEWLGEIDDGHPLE